MKFAQHLEEFRAALRGHAKRYGIELSADDSARLGNYYELLLAWNARLHLVAPCSPTEFAKRHVLESLLLLPHLSEGARVADIGSGAGLPIIPNLIARPDVQGLLIESSQKKSIFLQEALRVSEVSAQAQVIAERFADVPSPEVNTITCRALDRFSELFPKLVDWAPRSCKLLLFGGPGLQEQIEDAKLEFSAIKIFDTERRFLFSITKR